jgi:hypothetical protein
MKKVVDYMLHHENDNIEEIQSKFSPEGFVAVCIMKT